MDEFVDITCNFCQGILRVPSSFGKETGYCPHCNEAVQVATLIQKAITPKEPQTPPVDQQKLDELNKKFSQLEEEKERIKEEKKRLEDEREKLAQEKAILDQTIQDREQIERDRQQLLQTEEDLKKEVSEAVQELRAAKEELLSQQERSMATAEQLFAEEFDLKKNKGVNLPDKLKENLTSFDKEVNISTVSAHKSKFVQKEKKQGFTPVKSIRFTPEVKAKESAESKEEQKKNDFGAFKKLESSREDLEFGKIDELLNNLNEPEKLEEKPKEEKASKGIEKIDLNKGKNDWMFSHEAGEEDIAIANREASHAPTPKEEIEAELVSKTVSTVLKNTTEENELPTARPVRQDRNPMTTVDPVVNEGRSANSRWYIRGLKNRHPHQFKLAAFFSTATIVLFVLTFVAFGVIAITRLSPNIFLYSLFVAFLLCGFLTLRFMGKTGCMVCGQKQMHPKSCHKHQRAHKVPLIGTMFPTMWHGFVFKWFRCRFCGTANRLKG